MFVNTSIRHPFFARHEQDSPLVQRFLSSKTPLSLSQRISDTRTSLDQSDESLDIYTHLQDSSQSELAEPYDDSLDPPFSQEQSYYTASEQNQTQHLFTYRIPLPRHYVDVFYQTDFAAFMQETRGIQTAILLSDSCLLQDTSLAKIAAVVDEISFTDSEKEIARFALDNCSDNIGCLSEPSLLTSYTQESKSKLISIHSSRIVPPESSHQPAPLPSHTSDIFGEPECKSVQSRTKDQLITCIVHLPNSMSLRGAIIGSSGARIREMAFRNGIADFPHISIVSELFFHGTPSQLHGLLGDIRAYISTLADHSHFADEEMYRWFVADVAPARDPNALPNEFWDVVVLLEDDDQIRELQATLRRLGYWLRPKFGIRALRYSRDEQNRLCIQFHGNEESVRATVEWCGRMLVGHLRDWAALAEYA